MLKNLTLHLVILLLLVCLFFTLGWIDKSRFDKASISYKPQLLFAHEKIGIQDGGSVIWESFIYHAYESRRMKVIRLGENSKHEVEIRSGFQGTSWSWKPLNLLWILLILSLSFIYQWMKRREHYTM